MFKRVGIVFVAVCSISGIVSGQNALKPKYDLNKIGVRGIGSGLNTYSLEREARLGQRMAESVTQEVRLVRDPVVVAYVTQLTNRLAQHSDMPMPYTVMVVDSDQTEAFSLPGGFMFVDTGLVLATEDEAQLAGVIAHEVAHVAARHATRLKSRSFLVNLASIPLSFAGPLAYTAGTAAPIYTAKFAREAEYEADLLGLQFMYAAGYDPAEFVRFFERLTADQRKLWNPRLLAMMVPEPSAKARLAKVTAIVSSTLPPKDDYIVSSSDYEAAKARLLSLGNYQGKSIDDDGRPRLRKPHVPPRSISASEAPGSGTPETPKNRLDPGIPGQSEPDLDVLLVGHPGAQALRAF